MCSNRALVSDSFLIALFSSVPGKVSQLAMEGDGESNSLKLTWAPPAGDWENYSVLLYNGTQLLVNKTLKKEALEDNFSGLDLLPGRLYRAEVRVDSGALGPEEACYGGIGELSSGLGSVFFLEGHELILQAVEH